MTFKAEHDIGDIVYLKTDKEQSERIVIGVIFREGSVQYELNENCFTSVHFGFEISKEKDVLKTVK